MSSCCTRGQWVYPRVCGGTLVRQRRAVKAEGLSPRVRGNPGGRCGLWSASRSIPACAGEPLPAFAVAVATAVYPRVCGGTVVAGRNGQARHGLSPRVRGNLMPTRRPTDDLRSIPACAGEPYGAGLDHPVREVYPRVCGGTPRIPVVKIFVLGLSPRVRGNPASRPCP